jgi:hypothetical protein
LTVVRPRKGLAVLFGVALAGVALLGWGPDAAAAATCNTFDSNNTPTTAFTGGEKIVVRGTGFAANSVVLVNLQQGNRTIDLARVRANDLGAFALSDATVPADVGEGDAAIRALDARGSATCAITLAPGEDADGSLGGLFLVWGIVLAAFGAVLAALTYRRWKAARLREAVDSLAWRDPSEERAVEPAPREPVAIAASSRGDTAPATTDPTPSWVRPPSAQEPSPWTSDDRPPSWVRTAEERAADLRSSGVASHDLRDEVADAWTRDEELSSPWSAPSRTSDDDLSDRGARRPGTGAPLPSRPERPVTQRPTPRRPGFDDPWPSVPDDDDLSSLGPPRPFDDRFAVDDAPSRPSARDVHGQPVVVDEEPEHDLEPFRPASFEENVVADRDDESVMSPSPWTELDPREEPPAPVEPFPPQAPWRAAVEPPVASAPPPRPSPEPAVHAPPPAVHAPPPPPITDLEPAAFVPVEPDASTEASVPAAEQPEVERLHQPIPTERAPDRRPSVSPRERAPSVPSTGADRDFASALRDFLDREDMAHDGGNTTSVPDVRPTERRPPTVRPGEDARPQERREPIGPVAPVAPRREPTEPERSDPVATPPARPSAPLRPMPVRPAAPGADREDAVPALDAPASAPAERIERDAFAPPPQPQRLAGPSAPAAPASRVADEPWAPQSSSPSLQPGPLPTVRQGPAPEPARASADAPPASRVVPQAPRRPDAEGEVRRSVAPPREASVRPGAEPAAYDPSRAAPMPPARRVDPDVLDHGPARRGDAFPAPDSPVTEPPVLPLGWDEGRLKPAPARTASDAIARLKREVRGWRDERDDRDELRT